MATSPKAQIVLTAEDRASRVIGNVKQELLGLAGTGTRLGAVLGPLGGIASAAAVIGGAGLLAIKNFAGQIDDLADTAEGLGVGAVALAEMRSKAAEAGVEAATLDKALAKINAQLVAAKGGDAKAKSFFDALGLNVAEIDNAEQAIGAMSNALSKYGNTAERSAFLSAQLGEKIGPKLAAYLTQGADGLRQFTGLTEQSIEDSIKLQREIDKLATRWERLKNEILGAGAALTNTILEKAGSASLNDGTRRLERLTGLIEARRKALASERRPEFAEAIRLEIDGMERDAANLARTIGTVKQQLLGVTGYGEGSNTLKLPTEETKTRTRATAELKEATDDYARSLRLAQLAESDRRGVEELQAAADAYRALQTEIEGVNDLTGRSAANKYLQDLQLLDRAFFDGINGRKISFEEHEAGMKRLAGMTSDVTKETKDLNDASREFALTMVSALGQVITRGGDARDIVNALGQDLLQIGTRAWVLKPLEKAIDGVDFGAIFNSILKFAGFGAEGLRVPPGQWGIAGEYGPEPVFGGTSGATIVPPGGGASGKSIVVNVINQGQPMRAQQRTRETPTSTIVDLVLSEVAADVRRGGRVAGAMQAQYGLNRATGLMR